MLFLLHYQEEQQDELENMQEMDILDMNVLDEAENDNGMPVEEDIDEDEILKSPNEEGNQVEEDVAMKDEEQDNGVMESEADSKVEEVRRLMVQGS